MKRVVWVNGCFDILHAGHIELFKYAKLMGDTVIVGLDTDERVTKLKGKNRPIIPLADRKELVEAIEYVDQVVIFNSDEELKLMIKNNWVTSIVVGEEYRNKEVIGSQFADQVLYFEYKRGRSTTLIINKILSEYCKERYYK